jgi:hypothetical protein
MVKPLSEHLTELSVHAKSAEDAAASAPKEAHDKVAALQEQAREALTKAVDKVNQDIKSAGESATKNWNAVKAKIAADMTSLKDDVARTKHKLDVKRADQRAQQLEKDAAVAIDYAITSIEQVKLAVLNAVEGRVRAEQIE